VNPQRLRSVSVAVRGYATARTRHKRARELPHLHDLARPPSVYCAIARRRYGTSTSVSANDALRQGDMPWPTRGGRRLVHPLARWTGSGRRTFVPEPGSAWRRSTGTRRWRSSRSAYFPADRCHRSPRGQGRCLPWALPVADPAEHDRSGAPGVWCPVRYW